MSKKKLIPILVVLIACVAFTLPAAETGADPSGTEVLIDKGNGETYWTTGTGSTMKEIFESACGNLSFTFSSSGGTVTVDGLQSRTIGTTVCQWNCYVYSGGWVKTAYSDTAACSGTAIALGFYTDDILPTVTPDHKNAWTMVHADALNSGSVTNYQPSTSAASITFTHGSTERIKPSCYAGALYENGHTYFTSEDYSKKSSDAPYLKSRVVCYDSTDGTKMWEYTSDPIGYELSTGAIYNGNIYFVKNNGNINCIPLYGSEQGTITHTYHTAVGPIPSSEGYIETGLSCVMYDSGHIFVGSSAGTILCLTPDLELVWITNVDGAIYPSSSFTIADGRLYVGDCRGYLTIIDETNGEVLAKKLVYFEGKGRVNPPAVLGEYIIASYNDGGGMSAAMWAGIVLKYNASTNALTEVRNLTELCVKGAYMVISPYKTHVFAIADSDVYKIYPSGNYEHMFSVPEIHGGLTLVDNTYFYATEYNSGAGSESGAVVVYNMSGERVNAIDKPAIIQNYSMNSTVVAGPYVIACTDAGGMEITGSMVSGGDDPDPPGPDPPGPDPPGPDPPGPDPPAPTGSEVKFLIADETEFYFCISGTGTTALTAFIDAVNKYGYSDHVTYTGTADHPTGILSFFGLSQKAISSTQTQYWITFTWDTDDSEWYTDLSLDALPAADNPQVLLYYGTATGMSPSAPESFPGGPDLQPLKKSDEGTRFMLESAMGLFFVMNGSGDTVKDAFANACAENAVPYTETGGSLKIFNVAAKDGYSWNSFEGSSGGWKAIDGITASGAAATAPLYGLYYSLSGDLPTVSTSSIMAFPSSDNLLGEIMKYAAIAVAIIILALVLAYLIHIKRTQPMGVAAYIRMTLKRHNPTGSKVKHNKMKLLVVCAIGLLATFAMFLCSLAIGPSVSLGLGDSFSALISAIGKGGKDLTFNEIIVYQSRLPRAIAALAVGIGLSIAGCVYQAIIRNPLVDPYIMGVSSGAGTFAVAAISANFTFFGLLAANTFSTPILAVMGGLLAFGLTLLIAEKAGGSSTNYVLAGVVIGLVFSAIQTLLLVTSNSEKLTSAISWLFGSFANVGWDTVWIIFFPAIFLALVPLFWAKELNLVLLGEDQAKQMGLDVRKFNRWMLILASILTSVCVAFVGIIGFVGMVIPHLCRMLLGGDHRLVLPASIMMGGALMLFADLMAKMLMIPTELPVGAITTIIGVPVFAYLLIKKGRMYSG